ncbi:GGDEF domain-containing protein [Vibrio sp. WJH972]
MIRLQIEAKNLKLGEVGFRRWLLVGILILSILITSFSLQQLPPIDRIKALNFSFIFEFMGLFALFIIFFTVQVSSILSFRGHALLSFGLYLWILATVVDIGDEFYFQPLSLSLWGEDVLRTIGMLISTAGIARAIRTVSISYNQAKNLAMFDELTQLPNRRYFAQVLNNHEAEKLSILLVDIDHFKLINDTYGHQEGDNVLRAFGQSLAEMMSSNIIVSRIGGEEFAIIINNDDKNQVMTLANAVMENIKTLDIQHGNGITVSIGIAIKKSNEPSRDAIKRADDALYHAKQNGRNRVEWI